PSAAPPPARLVAFAFGDQPGVHRNERRGERTLAEDVLEDVGDPERLREGIGRAGEAEEVREDALPDESRDPAEEDARGDETRRAATRRRGAQGDGGGG